jgi:predicted lipoprotein with Yx(FWY)xxD motif
MHAIRQTLVALLPAGIMSLSVLALAGCGTTAPVAGAAYGASPSASAAAAGMTTKGAAPMKPAQILLVVEKTGIGYVLATAAGKTVYTYSKDVKGSGKPACTGSCATVWPAVSGTPSVGTGVKLAGTVGSTGGTAPQATYDGMPLYTYASDKTPGATSGNGVGSVWHVVTGTALAASATVAAADATASAKAEAAAASGSAGAASSTPSAGMSTAVSSGY